LAQLQRRQQAESGMQKQEVTGEMHERNIAAFIWGRNKSRLTSSQLHHPRRFNCRFIERGCVIATMRTAFSLDQAIGKIGLAIPKHPNCLPHDFCILNP